MKFVDRVACLFPQIRLNREIYHCPYCGYPVRIESVVRYPSQLAKRAQRRILARQCNHEDDCALLDKSSCPMEVFSFRVQPA